MPTLMPGKQIPLASAAYVYSLTGKIASMKQGCAILNNGSEFLETGCLGLKPVLSQGV